MRTRAPAGRPALLLARGHSGLPRALAGVRTLCTLRTLRTLRTRTRTGPPAVCPLLRLPALPARRSAPAFLGLFSPRFCHRLRARASTWASARPCGGHTLGVTAVSAVCRRVLSSLRGAVCAVPACPALTARSSLCVSEKWTRGWGDLSQPLTLSPGCIWGFPFGPFSLRTHRRGCWGHSRLRPQALGGWSSPFCG